MAYLLNPLIALNQINIMKNRVPILPASALETLHRHALNCIVRTDRLHALEQVHPSECRNCQPGNRR